MNIIRDYLVELAKYLPEFLRKDPEMSAVLEAESREHRVQMDMLKDLLNQLFIDSATWGLSNFERNLGIQPEADDDYIRRRNKILLYLQQRKTVTKEFMAKLAARYFSEDAIIEPKEDNPNDMFWIVGHGGKLLYPEDFYDAMDTYIPAHLGFGLRLDWTLDMTAEDRLRVGMATLKGAFRRIGAYLPDEERQRIGIALLGGVAGVKHIGVSPNAPQETFPLGVRLGHLRGGRLSIGADSSDLAGHFKDILGSANLLPRMGIMAASKGIRRIPFIAEQAGKFAIPIIEQIGQKGKRRYGLAPPKEAEISLGTGTASVLSGRKEIPADKSELSERFKDILEDAHIVPRIATGNAKTGQKNIGIQKPGRADMTLASGFFHATGGYIVIGANREDLPPRRIMPHVGLMHVGTLAAG